MGQTPLEQVAATRELLLHQLLVPVHTRIRPAKTFWRQLEES
jgi:hypothetical protein